MRISKDLFIIIENEMWRFERLVPTTKIPSTVVCCPRLIHHMEYIYLLQLCVMLLFRTIPAYPRPLLSAWTNTSPAWGLPLCRTSFAKSYLTKSVPSTFMQICTLYSSSRRTSRPRTSLGLQPEALDQLLAYGEEINDIQVLVYQTSMTYFVPHREDIISQWSAQGTSIAQAGGFGCVSRGLRGGQLSPPSSISR